MVFSSWVEEVVATPALPPKGLVVGVLLPGRRWHHVGAPGAWLDTVMDRRRRHLHGSTWFAGVAPVVAGGRG